MCRSTMADHEQQQFHYSYKIVLLGEIGVGKTAIFNRIKTGRFIDRAAPEIAGKRADQYTYNTYIDENSLTVTLWDTAGGERLRTLPNNFYRNADGVLLVFSIEDAYTFENLERWITEALKYVKDTCEWTLIRNKCDIQDTSETKISDILRFCEQSPNKLYFATSAKSGENVMRAFESLICNIHKKHVSSQLSSHKPKIDSVIIIESTDDKKKRRKFCCS